MIFLSINKIANPILFTDNSILISNANSSEFKINIGSVLKGTLNCEKPQFLQFLKKP
jgi:hypothetical protein